MKPEAEGIEAADEVAAGAVVERAAGLGHGPGAGITDVRVVERSCRRPINPDRHPIGTTTPASLPELPARPPVPPLLPPPPAAPPAEPACAPPAPACVPPAPVPAPPDPVAPAALPPCPAAPGPDAPPAPAGPPPRPPPPAEAATRVPRTPPGRLRRRSGRRFGPDWRPLPPGASATSVGEITAPPGRSRPEPLAGHDSIRACSSPRWARCHDLPPSLGGIRADNFVRKRQSP